VLAGYLLSQSQFKASFLEVLDQRNRGKASFLWFQCFQRDGHVLQKSNATVGSRALPRPLVQAETAVDRVTLYIMMRNTKRAL
jgi:hypothetical protein